MLKDSEKWLFRWDLPPSRPSYAGGSRAGSSAGGTSLGGASLSGGGAGGSGGRKRPSSRSLMRIFSSTGRRVVPLLSPTALPPRSAEEYWTPAPGSPSSTQRSCHYASYASDGGALGSPGAAAGGAGGARFGQAGPSCPGDL